jgi:hypothetical protein
MDVKNLVLGSDGFLRWVEPWGKGSLATARNSAGVLDVFLVSPISMEMEMNRVHTTHRFTELDFLAWIAAAFMTLALAASLLARNPDRMSHDPIAVPAIDQGVAAT